MGRLRLGEYWINVLVWLVIIFGVAMSSLGDVKAKANSMDVHTECGFTRFPKLCVETLSGLGSEPNQYADIISTLVNKTIRETKQLPASNFAKLSYHFITPEAQHARFATGVYMCSSSTTQN